MMICRKKFFAFYHVPKTGGVSIGTALRPYVDKPGQKRMDGELSAFRAYHYHGLHTRVGKRKVGLKRCAFVRNPWHRAVSIWRTCRGAGEGIVALWERGVPTNPDATRPMLYYCDPSFDFIGRFENLVSDFGRMCEFMGIDTPALLHENENLQFGPVLGPDWRSFYDDESREYIGDRFKEDIAAFNYTFEE